MVSKAKEIFFNYHLRTRLKQLNRKAKTMNYDDTKTVAILFELKEEADLKFVQKQIKFLREEEGLQRIDTLGYIDSKEMPEYLFNKTQFSFYNKKDFNWAGIPNNQSLESFMYKDFDLLLYMSFDKCQPLKFLLACSNAKFKVGIRDNYVKHHLDMMLDSKENNTQEKVNQINKFLRIINKPSRNVA